MGRFAEGKTPTIGQLRPHHRSMCRAMVFGNLKPGQLAVVYGMTPGQITRVVNSPLFQAEVSRLESLTETEMLDVSVELQLRQPAAIETIDEVLYNKSVDLKLRKDTAFEVLDRTGFGKKSEPQRHEHLHLHAEVSKMETEDLAKEALDLLEE